jgi:predicted aminopeptidase
MSRREAIDGLIAARETPPELRDRLATMLEIRDFASQELGLPNNGSYRSYADLDRPYVVWSVFAAPEFSLTPQTWCFPFVGCVAYRGYFSEERARDYAQGLAADGLDVYVAGIAAYSTLGRFSDPVLNTMLVSGDSYLAGLIFHELSHQQLYIEDDSAFNEGFASLVEEEGVRRWLISRGDETAWTDWLERRERRRQFNNLVAASIGELRALYASELTPDSMRAEKKVITGAMREAHARLREQWGGTSSYEAWFRGPMNNAQLSSVATYREFVPAFRTLLEQSNGDLEVFYRRAAEIGELPVGARHRMLDELLGRGVVGHRGAVLGEPYH